MVRNVTLTEDKPIEQLLTKLPIELRAGGLQKATRAGGNVVKKRARELCPIGDPNHKPENKPLKDTIKNKVRGYQNDRVWVSVVGTSSPQGNHGHLVDKGHRVRARGPAGGGSPGAFTGARVEGKEFIAGAADSTKQQQDSAIIEKLRKETFKNA